MTGAVAVDPRAARAWPFLRGVRLPAGAVILGPAGERVRLRADGGVDEVIQGGRPRGGISADPSAAVRRGA